MMKGLLAVEPNRISDAAIRVLRTVQLPRGSEVFPFHVNSISQTLRGFAKERMVKTSSYVKEIEKEVHTQACQFLGTIEKRLSGHQDVHVHSLVRKGSPGEEVSKMIGTHGVDLVVLGTRGYSKTKGFFWAV